MMDDAVMGNEDDAVSHRTDIASLSISDVAYRRQTGRRAAYDLDGHGMLV